MGISVNCLAELRRVSSEFPRRFVPDDLDFSDWKNLEPLFWYLLDRKFDSKDALEQWLLDNSELSASIREEFVRRRIAIACDMSGTQAEKAFLHFVENILPKLAPYEHKINLKFLGCPYLDELDEERYEVAIRERRCSVKLFREENIPLQVEIDKLTQQYQKITAAMTVNFKGKEFTMPEMFIFFQDRNRDVREEAWKLTCERRLQDAGELNKLFDKLLRLRIQVARNSGFSDFLEYISCVENRFDYTQEDCLCLHNSTERHILSLNRRIVEERRQALHIDAVRPWDMYCDQYGMDRLRPFESIIMLSSGCREIFGRIDKEFGDNFQMMIDFSLLDLESRKDKAPLNYQMPLPEVRLPYIFMSVVGLNHDVFALLHEGGHALHQFAFREEPLLEYRSSPNEFAEVAAMSIELLSLAYLDVFYNRGNAARARRRHFEDTIGLFPEVGIIDTFQHWIYTHPEHTSRERSDQWINLMERFSIGVDWTGLEEAYRYYWHSIPHIFLRPFYFIEYAVAQLGALQIWQNSRKDKDGAIKAFKSALRLGGSRPLPELFRVANIKFDFSDRIIQPLMTEVYEEVKRQREMESK